MHLEGPYFSFEQRGAQNPEYLRTPNDGTADLLLEHADRPLVEISQIASGRDPFIS